MTSDTDTDLDFDARLRERLARLEGAAPVGAAPADGSVAVASPSRRRRVRRRVVAALAAAAVLVIAGGVAGQRMLWPDEQPEPRLEAALAAVLAEVDCLSVPELEPHVRVAMNEAGYADWTIERRSGASGLPCATGGVSSGTHSVILMPASGEELIAGVEALAHELFTNCMKRGDAIEFFTSGLTALGVTDFEVSADPWGPQGGPVELIDAYRAHVANGCTVYSGMGWKENGTLQYYLWANWP